MSEFKGTPGPWAVNIIGAHWNNPGFKHIEVTFSEDDECVCDTVYQIEDANLIAAAPELLEACLRTQAQFRQAGIEAKSGSLNPAEDNASRIDAAIAKALGK